MELAAGLGLQRARPGRDRRGCASSRCWTPPSPGVVPAGGVETGAGGTAGRARPPASSAWPPGAAAAVAVRRRAGLPAPSRAARARRVSRPAPGRHRATADPPAGRHRAPRRGRATRRRLGLAAAAALVGPVALVAAAVRRRRPGRRGGRRVASAGRAGARRRGRADPAAARRPCGCGCRRSGWTARCVELGVDDAGALVPPADFDQAGWFTGGPAPGEIGPAVIAGHVDSRERPGGVLPARRARRRATTCWSTAPTGRRCASPSPGSAGTRRTTSRPRRSTGPRRTPELRLITCGGEFDRDRRSYRDNVVVYAPSWPASGGRSRARQQAVCQCRRRSAAESVSQGSRSESRA